VHRANDLAIREHIQKVTPAPFARRNSFCSNRLCQNKYEMYEWIQEAIAKGITDVHENSLFCSTEGNQLVLILKLHDFSNG
jgi:hypothetical protein